MLFSLLSPLVVESFEVATIFVGLREFFCVVGSGFSWVLARVFSRLLTISKNFGFFKSPLRVEAHLTFIFCFCTLQTLESMPAPFLFLSCFAHLLSDRFGEDLFGLYKQRFSVLLFFTLHKTGKFSCKLIWAYLVFYFCLPFAISHPRFYVSAYRMRSHKQGTYA